MDGSVASAWPRRTASAASAVAIAVCRHLPPPYHGRSTKPCCQSPLKKSIGGLFFQKISKRMKLEISVAASTSLSQIIIDEK